uniref:Uncharacterized protein n=1 Tax=Pyxicephalus adspersus TaxID=30357 RepID=A0AAV3AIN9_PYXAD|nr:TPA: hypothetical protein GDO54_011394 [Pyxicephalus adspersus]
MCRIFGINCKVVQGYFKTNGMQNLFVFQLRMEKAEFDPMLGVYCSRLGEIFYFWVIGCSYSSWNDCLWVFAVILLSMLTYERLIFIP